MKKDLFCFYCVGGFGHESMAAAASETVLLSAGHWVVGSDRQSASYFFLLLLSTFQHCRCIQGLFALQVNCQVMLCYAMQCRVRNGWKGIRLLSGFSLVGLVSLGELINWTPSIHAPLALVLSPCPLSLDPCSFSLSVSCYCTIPKYGNAH